MFANLKRWVRGIPPRSGEASFQPPKPPQQREKEFFREDNLPDDADVMVNAGVLKPWRVESATGLRWFRAEGGAVDWWAEINQ